MGLGNDRAHHESAFTTNAFFFYASTILPSSLLCNHSYHKLGTTAQWCYHTSYSQSQQVTSDLTILISRAENADSHPGFTFQQLSTTADWF